jgi:pimeloyl-ACP methyl ester carboxylesterase
MYTPQDRSTVRLHGHTLAYLDLPGEGTPLLLLHGVASSIDTWGDIPQGLAALGHRVIAVDLLGHGESGPGNGDYSLGSNAASVRDLLDYLGVERVHMVGHSLGGGVAMQFTYQFGERVESLSLISSGGLGEQVNRALRAAALPGSELVMKLLVSKRVVSTLSRYEIFRGAVSSAVATDGQQSAEPPTSAKLRRLQDPQRLEGFLATLRSVVGPEGQRVSALDKLGLVDPHKVLIIWGEEDRVLPHSHGVAAHEMLPGSRFVLVPKAGHHPHNHAPDQVMSALSEHVVRVESATLSASTR